MKCVILDDYQNISISLADWSKLKNISVTNVTEKIQGDNLVSKLFNLSSELKDI